MHVSVSRLLCEKHIEMTNAVYFYYYYYFTYLHGSSLKTLLVRLCLQLKDMSPGLYLNFSNYLLTFW